MDFLTTIIETYSIKSSLSVNIPQATFGLYQWQPILCERTKDYFSMTANLLFVATLNFFGLIELNFRFRKQYLEHSLTNLWETKISIKSGTLVVEFISYLERLSDRYINLRVREETTEQDRLREYINRQENIRESRIRRHNNVIHSDSSIE